MSPTIPRIGQPTQDINPFPSGKVSTNVAAPPTGAFEGMPQTNKAALEMLTAERKRVEDTLAIENDNQLSIIRSQMEATTSQIKGKDAANIPDTYLPLWDAETKRISDNLPNDGQKQRFAVTAASHRNKLQDNFTKHSANEIENWGIKEKNSWEINKTNEIANAPDDVAHTAATVELQAGINDRYGKNSETAKAEFDRHVKWADSQYKNKSEARTIASISADIWVSYVKDPNDPVDIETMANKVREFSNDPAIVKGAITDLKERASEHIHAIKERDDSNLSKIWDAQNKGASLVDIRLSNEYKNLSDGGLRRDVRDKLEGYADKKEKRDNKVTPEQEQHLLELLSNNSEMQRTDLNEELASGRLTYRQSLVARKAKEKKDPARSKDAVNAALMLKDAFAGNLFDPNDPQKNKDIYQTVLDNYNNYVHDNFDNETYDPMSFVDKVLTREKKGWLQNLFDNTTEQQRLTAWQNKIAPPSVASTILGKSALPIKEGDTKKLQSGKTAIFKNGKWILSK